MSESVIMEMSELSKAHAEGRISRDQYRQRRARMLDALVGLEPRAVVVAQDATRPRQSPVTPQAGLVAAATPPVVAAAIRPIEEEVVTAVPAARRDVDASAPPRARSPWPWVVAGVVIVGAAAVYWWSRTSALPPAGEPQSAQVSPAAAAGPAAPDPATLVTGFLQHKDWSDVAVSAFNSAWWNLSDEQVAGLQAQPSAQQLRAEVASQLQEHSRKVQGGAAPLDPSAPLILLARNLNVPVPDQVMLSFAPRPPAPAQAPTQAPAQAPVAAPAASTTRPSSLPPAAKPPVKTPEVAVASAAVPVTPIATPAPPPVAVPPPAAPANAATNPAPTADPCAAYFTNPGKRKCRDGLRGGGEAPTLAIVPAGSFQMGSSANAEEQPVHTIVIAAAFAVTVGEIDVGIYRKFCVQTNRSCDLLKAQTNDAMPVAFVSWADANDFAAWLSNVTGQHYRLPSEAEWEYFARAGVKDEYWSSTPPDPSQAIYTSGSRKPVGTVEADASSILPNRWSIKHVAGNVREWTADSWTENYSGAPGGQAAGGDRVVRGGSFKDQLPKLRSAARTRVNGGTREAVTGFRLVRELHP